MHRIDDTMCYDTEGVNPDGGTDSSEPIDPAQNTNDERDRLFNENVDLALQEHKKFVQESGEKEKFILADLLSAAYDGLLDAATKFKPDAGRFFGNYAVQRIFGSMMDCLRARRPLKRALYEWMLEVEKTRRELEQELGRSVENFEIAEKLGMDYGKFCERLVDAEPSAVNPHTNNPMADHLPGDPESILGKAEQLAMICVAIERLEREPSTLDLARILRLHYIEGVPEKEIGKKFRNGTGQGSNGVSEGRISQMELTAKAAVIGLLAEHFPPDCFTHSAFEQKRLARGRKNSSRASRQYLATIDPRKMRADMKSACEEVLAPCQGSPERR